MAAPLLSDAMPVDFMPIPGDSDDEYDSDDDDLGWFNASKYGIYVSENRNWVWFYTNQHTLEPGMTYIIDKCQVVGGPFSDDEKVERVENCESSIVATVNPRNLNDIDESISECARSLMVLCIRDQHQKLRVLETRMHAMLKRFDHAVPVLQRETASNTDDNQDKADNTLLDEDERRHAAAMALYRRIRHTLQPNMHYAIDQNQVVAGPFKHQCQLFLHMEDVPTDYVVYVHAGPRDPESIGDTYERCMRLLLALGRRQMHRQIIAIETRIRIMFSRMHDGARYSHKTFVFKDRP